MSGSSASIGCTGGSGGGGPAGGGKGGGNSASVDFFLPATNQDARLFLGLPDAVELLRLLRPLSFSIGPSSSDFTLVMCS